MAQLLVCRSLAAILISGSEQESVLVQGPQMQPFACGERERGQGPCTLYWGHHTSHMRAENTSCPVSRYKGVSLSQCVTPSGHSGLLRWWDDAAAELQNNHNTSHYQRNQWVLQVYIYSQMNENVVCLFWILLMMCGSFVFHVKYSPTEQQWDASGMAKLPSLQGTILTICSSFCARGIH